MSLGDDRGVSFLGARSEVLQQLHALFVIVPLGIPQRRFPRFVDFVNVRTGSDERHYDTIVSFPCGLVKGGSAVRRRQVHISTRLYKIHDDMCVAFLSSHMQSRNAYQVLFIHIDTRIDQPLQHRHTVMTSGLGQSSL